MRAIPSFVWGDDGPLEKAELARRIEASALGAFSLDGTVGHFGIHHRCEDGTHILARDTLGVNKLFYAVQEDGAPVSSNYWFELLQQGHSAAAIWSIPSGCAGVFSPGARPRLVRHSQLRFAEQDEPSQPLHVHAERIKARLEATFRTLASTLARRPVYVALSGGLDSTVIAALAKEHVGNVTAVTFSVAGKMSEDLVSAQRVAEQLRIPLVRVEVTAAEILDTVDEALVFGQDWREFNVHCALVNAALARAIRAREGEHSDPVLLTGDVMNELMTDYTAVESRVGEHYGLPEVPVALLRRQLVAGLDAGDREVGIHWHHGIQTIQPYALCADAYTALPPSAFGDAGAKQALVWAVMGDRIPAHVYLRPKTRAQEGSSEGGGGTLGVCIDSGIDEAWLKSRFAELYGIPDNELRRYLRAGYYRCVERASTQPPRQSEVRELSPAKATGT